MFAQKGLPAIALRRQLQAGQVLLIVILVVIIASTIGLSLASRSITSLRSSTEEAESQKALSAAEAGIERAIQSNIPVEIPLVNNPSNNSSYSTDIEVIEESDSFTINGGSAIKDVTTDAVLRIIPNTVFKDEGADVWFVGHPDGTPDYTSALSPKFLHLYWGTPTEECGTQTSPAAIQAIVISRNKSTGVIRSYHYAYDSCGRSNNFTTAESGSFRVPGIPGVVFGNRTPETGANSDLAKGVNDIVFMRVIPIYKDAVIGIDTCRREPAETDCTSFPSQGYIISSTGKSGSANRKITVFKGYPQTYLPYLSYGLFVAN